MKLNLKTVLNGISGAKERAAVREVARGSALPLANSLLSSGGLAIKAGGSAVVKTAAAVHALVEGKLIVEAAGDMAALSGTVANAAFNVFVFCVDAAGTVTSLMGLEGASLAAVRFPAIPSDVAVLGFVIINPTGTGDFVGGTTVLDDATVVPNAAYVNTPFPFNPLIEV